MNYIKYLIPPFVAIAAFVCFALPVFAANGTLFISPGKKTVEPGKSFTIEIRANTGNTSRQTTRANISYPKHLLEAVSATSYGSDFSNSSVNINQSAGRVTYTAYDVTPPIGSNVFAYKVTFKVKAKGSAKVAFESDSAVNGVIAGRNDAQYTLGPTSCPAGQTGTPPNCKTPSKPTPPHPTPPTKPTRPNRPSPSQPSTTPAQPNTSLPSNSALLPLPIPSVPDTEEPVVSEEPVELPEETEDSFGIGNIRTKTLYDTSTIEWESNEPGTSTFTYGTSSDALDNDTAVTQVSPTSYSAKMTELKPGVKYFYMISTTEAADNSTEDEYNGTILTKGYPVKVILKQNDTPLSNATVGLKGYSGTTVSDDNGTVDFELKSGTYLMTVKTDGGTTEESITVKALPFASEGVPDTQNFEIAVASSTFSSGAGLIVTIVVGVLFVVAAIAVTVVIIIRKKRAAATTTGYQSIIEDDWTPQTTYTNPNTGEFNFPQPPPNAYGQPPQGDIPENEYFADLGSSPPKN